MMSVVCCAYLVPRVGNLDIGDPLTSLAALCGLNKTRGFLHLKMASCGFEQSEQGHEVTRGFAN